MQFNGNIPHLFNSFSRQQCKQNVAFSTCSCCVKTFVEANNGTISVEAENNPGYIHGSIQTMNKKILLIEDKTSLSETLCSLLELHQYDVVTAAKQ